MEIKFKYLKALFILALWSLLNCTSKNDQRPITVYDKNKQEPKNFKIEYINEPEGVSVYFDSLNTNKRYKVTINTFNESSENEEFSNSVLTISQKVNGVFNRELYDSIYTFRIKVDFKDFNNDNVNDVLIHNYSDMRSNWTYYLYLVDTLKNEFTKIKGFEYIGNPEFNKEYGVITSYVMSGIPWTAFYEIQADTIFDYGIGFEDYGPLYDTFDYQKHFDNAIQSILEKRKE